MEFCYYRVGLLTSRNLIDDGYGNLKPFQEIVFTSSFEPCSITTSSKSSIHGICEKLIVGTNGHVFINGDEDTDMMEFQSMAPSKTKANSAKLANTDTFSFSLGYLGGISIGDTNSSISGNRSLSKTFSFATSVTYDTQTLLIGTNLDDNNDTIWTYDYCPDGLTKAIANELKSSTAQVGKKSWFVSSECQGGISNLTVSFQPSFGIVETLTDGTISRLKLSSSKSVTSGFTVYDAGVSKKTTTINYGDTGY